MNKTSIRDIEAPRDTEVEIYIAEFQEDMMKFFFPTGRSYLVSLPKNRTWEGVQLEIGTTYVVKFIDYGEKYTKIIYMRRR